MKLIVVIIVMMVPSGILFGMPLEIERAFSSENTGREERKNAALAISAMIGDSKINMTDRIEAAKFAGKNKIPECINSLIENIDVVAHGVQKEVMPIEIMYPCVGSIVEIGDPTVPALVDAMQKEQSELRIKLITYALMRIKTKKTAIDLIDRRLTLSVTEGQRMRLNNAKAELNKWPENKIKIRD